MRWEVPESPEPTYQTTKRGKMMYEVRISEVSQPTKHTLNVRCGRTDCRTDVAQASPVQLWTLTTYGSSVSDFSRFPPHPKK
jgi:hypothetical protein